MYLSEPIYLCFYVYKGILHGGKEKYTIAVAGIGYVGLSNAILLAQHHKVYAVDDDEQRVAMINRRLSPIEDREIQKYLAEKRLYLFVTLML